MPSRLPSDMRKLLTSKAVHDRQVESPAAKVHGAHLPPLAPPPGDFEKQCQDCSVEIECGGRRQRVRRSLAGVHVCAERDRGSRT